MTTSQDIEDLDEDELQAQIIFTNNGNTAQQNWGLQGTMLNDIPAPGYYRFVFRDYDGYSYAAIDDIEITGPQLIAVPSALTAGTHVVNDTLTAANGCDSIIHTTWHVNPTYSQVQNYEVCPDAYPVTYSGQTFTGPATKTASLTTTVGSCDSTISITVVNKSTASVSAALDNNGDQTVCLGSAITAIRFTHANGTVSVAGLPAGVTFDGDTRITGTPTTAGTYTYTITCASGNGCANATRTGTITVNAPQSTKYTHSACATYTWGTDPATNGGFGHGNGSTYNASGTYNGTPYTDANSCTATDTLALTINSLPTLNASSKTNVSCNGGKDRKSVV